MSLLREVVIFRRRINRCGGTSRSRTTCRGRRSWRFDFASFKGLSTKVPTWVTGGFDFSADRFDIKAQSDGRPTKDQMRLMMQALLADRFKLIVHYETRQAPVFALMLVKPGQTGPTLVPHPASDACAVGPTVEGVDDSASNEPTPGSALEELPKVCRGDAHLPTIATGDIRFGGRGVTLSLLASSLPTMTGMATLPIPVIDETGLSGTSDFTLDLVPDFNVPPDASGPNFRESLEGAAWARLGGATRASDYPGHRSCGAPFG